MLMIHWLILVSPLALMIVLLSFPKVRAKLNNFYGILLIIIISLVLGGYWGYGWAVGTDMVMGGFWGYEYEGYDMPIDWDGVYWSLYGSFTVGITILSVYLLMIAWAWLKRHFFWMGFLWGTFISGVLSMLSTLYGTLDLFLFYLFPVKNEVLGLGRWFEMIVIFLSLLFYAFLAGCMTLFWNLRKMKKP